MNHIINQTEYKDSPVGRIPTDWEFKKLKQCLASKPEYGSGASANPYHEGLVRYIRITDINDEGKLDESQKVRISKADAENKLLEKNDVLIARTGNTVGKNYIHKADDEETAFAGYLIRFKTNPEKLSSDFLFNFTQSPYYKNWIKNMRRVGAQPNINAQGYGDMLLPFSPLSEQEKIASILTTVDEVIEKIELQISKLQDLKKGMMQELLTEGIGHTEFKDSPVGRIPKSWKSRKLNSVLDVIDSLHSTPQFASKGYPMVRVTDIKEGNLKLENSMRVSKKDYLKC